MRDEVTISLSAEEAETIISALGSDSPASPELFEGAGIELISVLARMASNIKNHRDGVVSSTTRPDKLLDILHSKAAADYSQYTQQEGQLSPLDDVKDSLKRHGLKFNHCPGQMFLAPTLLVDTCMERIEGCLGEGNDTVVEVFFNSMSDKEYQQLSLGDCIDLLLSWGMGESFAPLLE